MLQIFIKTSYVISSFLLMKLFQFFLHEWSKYCPVHHKKDDIQE